MSTRLEFEAEIHASAEAVFALLADLRNYDRWLPESSAFHGTGEISDGPIRVGTTYVERGPVGVRRGRVTRFDPPARLGFEQPMTIKPRGAGTVHIRLAHTLTPSADHVHLRREVIMDLSGPVRLARPVFKRAVATENQRVMQTLKAYAEATARGSVNVG